VAVWRFTVSAHSQIRSTFHPAFRSPRLTRASRALFPAIFAYQNVRCCFGLVAWRGQTYVNDFNATVKISN